MTDINKVVEHYIALRDHIAKLEAEHKATVGEFKAQMQNAENYLLNMMNETGQSNAGFAAGTVIVSTKTMPSLKDKGALINYIKQTGQVELLQARVSSTAVKEFMDANQNQLPPGVEVTTSREVSVRRK